MLKSDKQTRQGLYQALYNRKTAIAHGYYEKEKKTGIWHFYNKKGVLIENYNYDTNTLLYEAPEDSTSNIFYVIDNKLNDTDIITKPIKPGGRYYGYLPYLKNFRLPNDLYDINRLSFSGVIELLISPGGRLADFKVHIKSAAYDKVINMNVEAVDEEDKTFYPATLNKVPISSRIFINCFLTADGRLKINL